MSDFSRFSLVALAAICLPSFALAADEKKLFDVNGFVDLYYQYDFGKPGSNGTSEVNTRQFDVRYNRYRLNLGYVDISKAPDEKCPFGVDLTLVSGPAADIIAAYEPGGADSWKNFGQAFISYKVPGKSGLQFDFGKFWTPIGYEAVDSRSQDFYSHSFNYYTNQPLYHTGIRATAPLSDKLTVAGYAIQGWNEVQDSNSNKSFILSASYAATPKLGLSLSGYAGTEGSKDGSVSGIGYGATGSTTLVDGIATYQLDGATKLVVNADYLSTKGIGKSNGVALYAKHTLGTTTAVGLRLEHVEDLDGVRTGIASILNSFTAVYDYNVTSNLLFRFEAREDISNVPAFTADSGLKKNRTTLTFAQVLKF